MTTNPILERLKERQKNQAWRTQAIKLGIRIIDQLKAKGMTQKELAEKLDKKPQWISRIVKGKENMTLATMVAIQEQLDMQLISLPQHRPAHTIHLDRSHYSPSYAYTKQVSAEAKVTSINVKRSVPSKVVGNA